MKKQLSNMGYLVTLLLTDLFNNKYLVNPKCENSYIGYYGNNLLEMKRSNNRISFHFVPTAENYILDEVVKDFETMLKKHCTDKISCLIEVESFTSGQWLNCDFYLKEL